MLQFLYIYAMNHYLVECCANTIHSAIDGKLGRANRVEFCTTLEVGGITPSREDIQKAKGLLNIPLHVLIRPKVGDFVHTGKEILQMMNDIQFCKKVGCNGIVIGLLNKDVSINKEQCKQLVFEIFTFQEA